MCSFDLRRITDPRLHVVGKSFSAQWLDHTSQTNLETNSGNSNYEITDLHLFKGSDGKRTSHAKFPSVDSRGEKIEIPLKAKHSTKFTIAQYIYQIDILGS